METKEQNPIERKLDEKAFEKCYEAIEGGKEDGSLHNVELVENLVNSCKGKTIQAPIEVIAISALLLNTNEIMATIEMLKHAMRMKMVEELKAKADKGEATVKDAMTAMMLAAIMKKEKESGED